MEQKISIRQTFVQKHDFNPSIEEGLKILRYNTQDLKVFLQEVSFSNPFLHYYTNDRETRDPFYYETKNSTLREQIFSQLNYENETVNEDLCDYLLSQLNTNGYFKCDLTSLLIHSTFTKEEIMHTISILQRMEPIGCFCFYLRDSLRIQCKMSEEAPSETGEILCDYLNEIADHKYDRIHTATNLPYDEIEEGIQFIRTLNPKPAANYSNNAIYLNPEAIIEVQDGDLKVHLLHQDFHLEIKENEDSMMNKSSEFKKLRQEALFIFNHVQKRNLTLIQILESLCEIQKDFFLEHAPLRYCTLQTVAQLCGLHPSTVSRAIDGKSFLFQGHEYPFQYLLRHNGNKSMDAPSIQRMIQNIIQEEKKDHPYSDSSIQKILTKKGIQLSRRTIAKYRKECHILPSSKRKEVNLQTNKKGE